MAIEFAASPQSEDIINDRLKSAVSRIAQIVTSVPDKARLKALPLLSSQYPFISAAVIFPFVYKYLSMYNVLTGRQILNMYMKL